MNAPNVGPFARLVLLASERKNLAAMLAELDAMDTAPTPADGTAERTEWVLRQLERVRLVLADVSFALEEILRDPRGTARRVLDSAPPREVAP